MVAWRSIDSKHPWDFGPCMVYPHSNWDKSWVETRGVELAGEPPPKTDAPAAAPETSSGPSASGGCGASSGTGRGAGTQSSAKAGEAWVSWHPRR